MEPQGVVPRDNATRAVWPYASFYFFWMLIPIANRRELQDYFCWSLLRIPLGGSIFHSRILSLVCDLHLV